MNNIEMLRRAAVCQYQLVHDNGDYIKRIPVFLEQHMIPGKVSGICLEYLGNDVYPIVVTAAGARVDYTPQEFEKGQTEIFKLYELLTIYWAEEMGLAHYRPETAQQFKDQIKIVKQLPHGCRIFEQTVYGCFMNAFTALRDVTYGFLSEMVRAEHRLAKRNQKELDFKLDSLKKAFDMISSKVTPAIVDLAHEGATRFYSLTDEYHNKSIDGMHTELGAVTAIPLTDIDFSGWFACVSNFGTAKTREFWANLPQSIPKTPRGINGLLQQFEAAYECSMEEVILTVLREAEGVLGSLNHPEELLKNLGPIISKLCLLALGGKPHAQDPKLVKSFTAFMDKEQELQKAASEKDEPSFALVEVPRVDIQIQAFIGQCLPILTSLVGPAPSAIVVSYIAPAHLDKADPASRARAFMKYDPLMRRMFDIDGRWKTTVAKHFMNKWDNFSYDPADKRNYGMQKLLEACAILKNLKSELLNKSHGEANKIVKQKPYGVFLLTAYDDKIDRLLSDFSKTDDFSGLIQKNDHLAISLDQDNNSRAVILKDYETAMERLNTSELRAYIERDRLLAHIFKDFDWATTGELEEDEFPKEIVPLDKTRFAVRMPARYNVHFQVGERNGPMFNLLQLPVNDPKIQAAILTLNNTYILPSVEQIQKIIEAQIDKSWNEEIARIEKSYKEPTATKMIQQDVIPIMDITQALREALLTPILFGVKAYVPGYLFKSDSHFHKPFKAIFLRGSVDALHKMACALLDCIRKPDLIKLLFTVSSVVVDSSRHMTKQFSNVK